METSAKQEHVIDCVRVLPDSIADGVLGQF